MYVRVDLRPSLILRVLRAAIHVMALASLLWVDLSDSLRVVLGFLIALKFLQSVKYPPQLPRAILFIDGRPRLLFEDRVLEYDLQAYVYCTSFLQVLHFRRCQLPRSSRDDSERSDTTGYEGRLPQEKHLSIVILPDSSNSSSRRQLRTMLRWQVMAVQGQSNRTDKPREVADQ